MIRRFHVVDERVVGQGGFLTLRRLRLRVETADGAISEEGLYDVVERPAGLDAIVLLLWSRGPAGVEVLLRSSVRVPLVFGRSDVEREPPAPLLEVVAGIVEPGDELAARAVAEAWEETGLRIEPSAIEPLGAPSYPTPGMCGERFHLVAAEVSPVARAAMHPEPETDGSPFELGAQLFWVPLDEALRRADAGELPDMKTELALRRLVSRLSSAR